MRNGLVGFALGGVLLVVAACGGGGGTTGASAPQAPAAATESSAPAGGGAGTSSQPSAEASVAAPASEPPAGGGGGTAAGVCELVTEEELAGILGVQVNTTVFAGPPDTCDVQSTDGAPLAAFVLTIMGGVSASAVYDAFASDPSSSDIPGIGEKAAYNPNQAVLIILKNGAVLTVAVFDDGTLDEAARVELMKKIGTIAAGRM